MSTSTQHELFEIPADMLTHKHDNIYSISVDNFVKLYENYKAFPLPPDNLLFPWLHGVDGDIGAQNLFFGVRRCLPPNYRGLMLVHCNDDPVIDNSNNNGLNEHTVLLNRGKIARLADSVLPEQVILTTTKEFVDSKSQRNTTMTTAAAARRDIASIINLRNYENQIARFSTLCDLILYGRHAEQIAESVAYAQRQLYQQRADHLDHVLKTAGKRAVMQANRIEYKVVIMEDNFSIFERMYPNYVLYDSDGILLQRKDLCTLESDEMREMSKASEITPNIWLGNTQDVPIVTTHDILLDDSTIDSNNDSGIVQEHQNQENETNATQQEDDDDDLFPNTNPHNFTICIEAHDLADMPLPSTLTLASETLDDDISSKPDIIHFDVYGSNIPDDEFDSFYSRLVHLLAFMQEQADKKHRRILIHCADGYTETSIVALTWIMYHEKLPLPEAYLYLQKRRSFFVYATDLQTLRRIEKLLFDGKEALEPQTKRRKSVPSAQEEERNNTTVLKQLKIGHHKEKNGDGGGGGDSGGLLKGSIHNDDKKDVATTMTGIDEEEEEEDTEEEEEEDEASMQRSKLTSTPKLDEISVKDNRVKQSDTFLNLVSNTMSGNDAMEISTPVRGEATTARTVYAQVQLSPTREEEERYPWFFSHRFEGSFPSRILPFLYLGNLNHATNPHMLKALNITHVVSVGENAKLDTEEFKLLYLDNLYDNGVDSIKPRLEEVIQFVEDARLNNGICLIHCRVGVSRSAAITIAYVMQLSKCTLVHAYLFVRARRLNVIIQPNLRFMYEMLQLDQRQNGKLSISWPILCQEIHNINFAYRDVNEIS